MTEDVSNWIIDLNRLQPGNLTCLIDGLVQDCSISRALAVLHQVIDMPIMMFILLYQSVYEKLHHLVLSKKMFLPLSEYLTIFRQGWHTSVLSL